YEQIPETESYSRRGLRLLSPTLETLNPLPLSAEEQRQEAIARTGKMSVQGVQKKLSAILKIKEAYFEIVDSGGLYILKPPSNEYPELPENEAITMTLAKQIGLDVPVHGLVYAKDNSMTYFIKRFDRVGHNDKVALEDFAQLSGEKRETKYDSSMEKVVSVISQFCTFPKIELARLFKLTLFNFLTGNEDMHLKNFSLITIDGKTSLSPAYDLLNSTIAISKPDEEMALPLNGKMRNITHKDLFKYFAVERLGLNQTVINDIKQLIQEALPLWKDYLSRSYLSVPMQQKYLALLETRCNRIDIKFS
ncbi:MAG: HipA domain-containing protein, partial [Gammaproteobacteria bacterium]